MKLATEIIDEATADATIDEVLRRDPADNTKEDYRLMIEAMRYKRAMFIENAEKKAAKKQGVDTDDEQDSA